MDMTLSAYVDSWLRDVALRCKPRTLTLYRTHCRLYILPSLGNRELRSLRRRDIRIAVQTWLAAGKSPGTAALCVNILRACLGCAVDDELLPTNPASRQGKLTRRRKGPLGFRVPDLQDAHALEAAMQKRYPHLHPWVLLLTRTGLRIGEAQGLRWTDVDLRQRRLVVQRSGPDTDSTKNDDDRVVPLSHAVCTALATLPRRSEWVFAGPSGKPYVGEWLRRALRRAAQDAGLGYHVTPHRLRHGWATEMSGRVPLPVLQQLLGHRTGVMTLLYARHRRGDLPYAVVDALDGDE